MFIKHIQSLVRVSVNIRETSHGQHLHVQMLNPIFSKLLLVSFG